MTKLTGEQANVISTLADGYDIAIVPIFALTDDDPDLFVYRLEDNRTWRVSASGETQELMSTDGETVRTQQPQQSQQHA